MMITAVNTTQNINNIQNFKGKIPNINNKTVINTTNGNVPTILVADALAATMIGTSKAQKNKEDVEIRKNINNDNAELAEYLLNLKDLDKSKIANILKGTLIHNNDYSSSYSSGEQIQRYLEVLKDSKTAKYVINQLNQGVSLQQALFTLELENNTTGYYNL